MKKKVTDSLYLDSAFGEWIEQCPANVIENYSEYNVDLQGKRVTVVFAIDDDYEEVEE